MPKVTSETKKCTECNLVHPLTWFQPYTLKDGVKTRSKKCKLCRESKDSLPSVESWTEQIVKILHDKKEKPNHSSSEFHQDDSIKQIRFVYNKGPHLDLWLALKTTLNKEQTPERTLFLTTWAENANLEYLPRVESAIGYNSSKSLRIKKSYEETDDIVITNILPDITSNPYLNDWTRSELINAMKAFIQTVSFEGHISAVITESFDSLQNT